MNSKSPLAWVSSPGTVIVTDFDELNEMLIKEGRKVQPLMLLNALPEECIILSFSTSASRHTFKIARDSTGGRRIFCALHVFEPSIDHARYALRAIFASDFDLAIRKQRFILERLNSGRRFSVLHGNCAAGTVELRQDAVPFATIMEDLDGSYIRSVAEFFEVHYAHMDRQVSCPFLFSGRLEVAGILVVLRSENLEDSQLLKERLNKFVSQVACHGALAEVKNNEIISFMVCDEEFVGLLGRAAGERGSCLTEFAIGVNQAVDAVIDYSINSQLNEGVAGIHVAIGDGSTGFHIDFLCPAYELV